MSAVMPRSSRASSGAPASEQLRRKLGAALARRLEQREVALPAVLQHLRSQLRAGEIGADLRVRARPAVGRGWDRSPLPLCPAPL
jgi:hypothetical protein